MRAYGSGLVIADLLLLAGYTRGFDGDAMPTYDQSAVLKASVLVFGTVLADGNPVTIAAR